MDVNVLFTLCPEGGPSKEVLEIVDIRDCINSTSYFEFICFSIRYNIPYPRAISFE